MSSLQRYKKSGGFVQLLSLIEVFGPQKKEKFLEMIEAESPVWAKTLRAKMLTLERIFQWPDQVCIEVFKNLPAKQLALGLEGLKEEQKNRLLAFFSAAEKRKIDDLLEESAAKPEDIASNMIKVIELTRKMLMHGDLRAEKFDEGLLIPEDIESKLESQAPQAWAEKVGEQVERQKEIHAVPTATAEAHPPTADISHMQRTLGVLLKENKTLKEEVRVLREKLDTIRRIA
jgi:hypothetical protein